MKELDGFDDFKDFIKLFIKQDIDLWKIIYYPLFSPLDQEEIENTEDIFETATVVGEDGETGIHGVVLFKQKNDKILNASMPIILISFKSLPKGNFDNYNNVYINFRILLKGEYIQDIQYKDDICSRVYIIAKLIDNNFNEANINGLGKVKRIGFDDIPINEENYGFSLTFRATSFSSDLINNKNIQKRLFGDSI